jgi:hypothetical protein
MARRKKFKKGQKVFYCGNEFEFLGYSKSSPSGVNQRVELKAEGKDYITETLESDMHEN